MTIHDQLSELIAATKAAAIPLPMRWLDAEQVGAMLGYSGRQVIERIACRPDSPRATLGALLLGLLAGAAVAADPVFAGRFEGQSRIVVFSPSGVHWHSGCVPGYVSGAGGWIVSATCAEVEVSPLPAGWSPMPGSHFDRVHAGDGAWIRCEVIEFEDDRHAGTWWVLAECLDG